MKHAGSRFVEIAQFVEPAVKNINSNSRKMDKHDLFLSCRRGDLHKIQYLVEQKEVNINIRDKWDSTPLYYACLCGHEEVVKYLLENGARCEANTFDGERCLYGALTDSIKKLLLSYNMVSSKVMRRDLYEEFLRRLQEPGMYQDVTLHIHGHEFPVHRCILTARSEFFGKLFQTKWAGKKTIYLKNKMVNPYAFRAVLQYIYMGQMEIHRDYVEECVVLARQCQLTALIPLIEKKCKELNDFERGKPGVNVTSILIEHQDQWALQMDFGTLADQALPRELCTLGAGELPFEPDFASTYADVIFLVQGHRFYCHKVFFCGRSDYFKALLIDHFDEGHHDAEISMQVIPISDVNVDCFTQIMFYLYQDACQLTVDNVYEVLCAADMYLLPGLKRYCANVMAEFLNIENVVMVLKTARLFNLPRLEDECAEYMANKLEKILQSPDFEKLVLEDAADVKNREETDSIDIIDNIRFHLTNFIQTYSEMQEANDSSRMLDDFLESLGLEC